MGTLLRMSQYVGGANMLIYRVNTLTYMLSKM